MYQNDPVKVLTGEVRLSYCNLTTPRPPKDNPNGTPKYSVTLLIPKNDQATVNDIVNSIRAAAQIATNSKWGGYCIPEANQFSILHDGDGVNESGKPYGDECKGHWVLAANSTVKPGVVDQSNINCDLAPSDIYSGMYARVTLRFYGTDKGGNKMCCGLGNVMKTRDGESLAGGASAASDFEGVGQAVAAPGGFGGVPGYPAASPVAPAPQFGAPAAPAGGFPGAYPPGYPPAPVAPAAPQMPQAPAFPGYPAAPGMSAAPASAPIGTVGSINPITGLPY